MTTSTDLLVEGSDKAGGPRYPTIKSMRGTHHLTVRKAFVKQSQTGNEYFAIAELEREDGVCFSFLERVDNGQKWPEYARARWRSFLEAAMAEAPSDNDGYAKLVTRAQTDQDGEIAGKKVTAVVRPGRNPKYNDVDWTTGHVGAAHSEEPTPAPSTVDAPPDVPKDPKAAALAAGYKVHPSSVDDPDPWMYKGDDIQRLSALA